jgi:hypothetical protein
MTIESIINICRVLNEANVRYVLIGGVAMRLQGSAHLTDDLDLCYALASPNVEALALAFVPYHPRLRGVPEDLPFLWDARTIKNGRNFTLETSLGQVDMLGEAAGAEDFDGLWERSEIKQLEDIEVRVAAIDDLIAMKRAANRPKDQSHVMELLALKKLLADEGTAE